MQCAWCAGLQLEGEYSVIFGSGHNYNTRLSTRFICPERCRLSATKKTFRHIAAQWWNDLPEGMITAPIYVTKFCVIMISVFRVSVFLYQFFVCIMYVCIHMLCCNCMHVHLLVCSCMEERHLAECRSWKSNQINQSNQIKSNL